MIIARYDHIENELANLVDFALGTRNLKDRTTTTKNLELIFNPEIIVVTIKNYSLNYKSLTQNAKAIQRLHPFTGSKEKAKDKHNLKLSIR